jgi:hypothetical protein
VKNWLGTREFCHSVGEAIALPADALAMFTAIDQRAASQTGGGAWDVFAWRDGQYLIMESKRHRSSDRLRPGQLAWAEAALAVGRDAVRLANVEYLPERQA